MSDKTRRKATQFVAWLIAKTKGEEAAEFWCWEMTPMPMGLPFNFQLWDGVKFAFGIKIKRNKDGR